MQQLNLGLDGVADLELEGMDKGWAQHMIVFWQKAPKQRGM